MLFSVGIKCGEYKTTCDDTAFVNRKVINEGICSEQIDSFTVAGVADGVGGNSGGKQASTFIAQILTKMDFQDDEESLKTQLIDLNSDLLNYANHTTDQKVMATTLTALINSKEKTFLVHIGNTRMYVAQGSYLKQITSDQTTYQWLLTHGSADIAENCNKNEISACMGGGNPGLVQQIEVRQVFEESIPYCIVFTSDGIHEYINIDRFEELIFSSHSDQEIIEAIICEAENNGSRDDKTILILRK